MVFAKYSIMSNHTSLNNNYDINRRRYISHTSTVNQCDVCWTHGDERFADGRQNIGPQRVQQQLVFGQNRQQQRTRVLRTQILQELHKTGPTESRASANQNTEHRRSSQSDRQQKNSPERQRRRDGLTEQQVIIRRELRTHRHTVNTHTHTHSLTLTHTHSHTLTHTHTHSLTLTLTLTHTHTQTLTHTHSKTLTLTHTLTHIYTHTRTHSHTHSHSHTFVLLYLWGLS